MTKKRKFFAGAPPGKETKMDRSDAVAGTDLHFIELVKSRQYREALALIDRVQNVNTVDPTTGATALHFAADRSCAGLVDALMQRADLDYLAQDRQGRYASELAWEGAGNEELGALLIRKEKEQADREGRTAWPKPPPRGPEPS